MPPMNEVELRDWFAGQALTGILMSPSTPRPGESMLSVHAAVQNAFNVQRHLVSRNTLRALRVEAFQNWRAATAA